VIGQVWFRRRNRRSVDMIGNLPFGAAELGQESRETGHKREKS
jgi:hypothetical protein